jgi:hypothetical protein
VDFPLAELPLDAQADRCPVGFGKRRIFHPLAKDRLRMESVEQACELWALPKESAKTATA